ncbi:hypothetical protein Lalb_Chr23g0278371 [Lupinus albus]|uniref:Uncharacterized protein n=1 Tax=Lupinus albus TaxID=3870 RepID=A0A6A4NAK3_LUPAL|nr:hypothetical protein Lalb_Chr23g0278371 [Lupinus albus]
MSRCFPFPPPGYEKKARIDNVDLLKKVYILFLYSLYILFDLSFFGDAIMKFILSWIALNVHLNGC